MNAVQFKADYAAGDSVPAGTIVLHEARLYFAIQGTNSKPDDVTVWAKIGEISKPSEPGFLDGLFGATPKAKTPAEIPNPEDVNRNLSGAQTLSFDNTQAGGRRHRRRTTKKPRRK